MYRRGEKRREVWCGGGLGLCVCVGRVLAGVLRREEVRLGWQMGADERMSGKGLDTKE